MEGIVEKLKHERNRSSTKQNYYSVWKSFNQFFIKLDRKPGTWEERLVLYVGFLINSNKKSSTIRSYISAIKAVLQEDGEELNENRFLLNSLIRACRLQNDFVRTRLPIKRNLLELIVNRLPSTFEAQNAYFLILYQALFITAFYGLFRVGELTESEHILRAKDVHIGRNKNKMMFVLHSSKTHNRGNKPQVIKINGSEYDVNGTRNVNNDSHCFCPFAIVKRYVAMRKQRKTENEQFFVSRNRDPVTADQFRVTLRKVIEDLGLDPQMYGTHSLRAGNAVQLVESGTPVEMVRKIGRWKSNAIYAYLRY